MDGSQTLTEASPAQQVKRLRRQIAGLRAMLARAQRLAAVGTMTAMVIHEFNNILTAACGRAQIALAGDAAQQKRALEQVVEAFTRATEVCQALLGLAGANDQTERRVLLGELIEQTLLAMARDVGKDGIVLVRQVPRGLAVRTCPGPMKQVLLNLLLNARSAVLDKAGARSIRVSAGRRADAVFLRVADTGVGIPPENRRRVFEPFFTTRGQAGSGLGLAVCRQIVESLGGRIALRSQANKGTCFTVVLPQQSGECKGATRRTTAAARV